MRGYDPNFLGEDTPLPLPEFSPALVGNVLNKPELRDGIYADYIHFTIAMNRDRRSPIYTALNINQSLIKSARRKKGWDIDTRIGGEFQLDNDYYRSNPWDRGHLARRGVVAWGETARDAKKASDYTFYYSNASLQHANFNQDEWLALENWVKALTLDDDGKITEFTGPVYGEFGRMISPTGRKPAETPSAFFKILCFISKKTKELDVRAFLMFQDKEALKDKYGKELFNYQRYQVTISEIEALTGLDFADKIYEQNPLIYNENPEVQDELNIPETPERIPVDTPDEMVSMDELREYAAEQEVPVFIAAAMVNALGSERENEWISIINLGSAAVDLAGWTMSDRIRKPLALSDALPPEKRILLPGEAVRIQPVTPIVLGNRGGVVALYDAPSEEFPQGRRIDRIHYTEDQASQEGVPVVFNSLISRQV